MNYQAACRLIQIVAGFVVLGTGIAMIVLPGPAIIVIPVGLKMLSVKYSWARRLSKKIHALKKSSIARWGWIFKGLTGKRRE